MPQDMNFKCLINNSIVRLLSFIQCKRIIWSAQQLSNESEVLLIICSYFTWKQLSKHWRTLLICFSWIIDNNYVTWKNIYHYIFIFVHLNMSTKLHDMSHDTKFKCLINNSSVSLLSLSQCKENYLTWQSEMSCVLHYCWFPAIV